MEFFGYTHACLTSSSTVEEIVDCYRTSLLEKTNGESIRREIDVAVNCISQRNGCSCSMLFSSLKEFYLHYNDIHSPLRNLHIIDGFVTITQSQRIPYSKVDFFKLLKRTSLKGLVVIFSLAYDDCDDQLTIDAEDHTNQFICIQEGESVKTTIFEDVFSSSLTVSSHDETPKEIDWAFEISDCKNSELGSCGIKYITEEFRGMKDLEMMLEIIENREWFGYLHFQGFNKQGGIITTDDSFCYKIFHIQECETGEFLVLERKINTNVEGTYQCLTVDSHFTLYNCVSNSNIPRDAKLSILGYSYIYSEVMRVTVNDMEDDDFDGKVPFMTNVSIYLEDIYVISHCYFTKSEILYLCTSEPITSGEVVLTNRRTYRIISLLVSEMDEEEAMFCYSITLA